MHRRFSDWAHANHMKQYPPKLTHHDVKMGEAVSSVTDGWPELDCKACFVKIWLFYLAFELQKGAMLPNKDLKIVAEMLHAFVSFIRIGNLAGFWLTASEAERQERGQNSTHSETYCPFLFRVLER